MVRFLSGYHWNWVGVVTTDGDYGRSALENFVSNASKNLICVAFKSILPDSITSQETPSAIGQTAETIYGNPKVNVIVSFAKPAHMMYLFQALKKQALAAGGNILSMKRVWIASDNWSSSNLVNKTLSLDEIGHVVGFHFKRGDLTSFHSFLSRIETEKNPNLEEFVKMLKEIGGGAVLTSLNRQLYSDSVFSVEMAVSAVAQAVVTLCRISDCKTQEAVQPWQVFPAHKTSSP